MSPVRQAVRRNSDFERGESKARRHRPDYILPLLSVILMVIGLITVFAISPALAASNNVSDNYYVSKQIIAIALGVAAFIVVGNIRPSTWKKAEKPLLITAVVASVLVRLLGEQVNGAYRWVQVAGFSFQVAELIKFTLVIWLAGFLATRIQEGTLQDWNKTLKPLLIALGVIGVLVAVLQSDLGSAAVMVSIMSAMVFVAGMPMKKVLLVGAVVLIGVFMAISTSAYRRSRVETFLNPTADCQGAGYQSCQALIAVGSGGMFGLGLARSVQAYGYLPEAANDSIFAIYAEKFGFLGSAVLIGLFVALFARIMKIFERAPDDYMRLLVAGVLAWLSTQAIINIGAMVGLLPLKGITLPFISYGGTSLLFVGAAVGLVFATSRYTNFRISLEVKGKVPSHEGSSGRRGQRGTYYAPPGRRS
jgi:cell division protein FtsW